MMKSGFEPGQLEGLNSFRWHNEDVTISHPGSCLPRIVSGQLVLFRRHDGLVWCGRTWPNFYEFVMDKPVTPWEALQWIASRNTRYQANLDDEFSGQEELPF